MAFAETMIDTRDFFNKEEFADVTVLLRHGERLRAHRLIMSRISPYLKEFLGSGEEYGVRRRDN